MSTVEGSPCAALCSNQRLLSGVKVRYLAEPSAQCEMQRVGVLAVDIAIIAQAVARPPYHLYCGRLYSMNNGSTPPCFCHALRIGR
jgi:hypothetical protein